MIKELYSNPDFQLNLIAEAHGLIVELVLITLIGTLAFTWWHNRKWKPARLNVAKKISRFHKALFNSSRHVIDPDFQIDLKAHGFPAHFTQADAMYWGKSQFVPYLDSTLNSLKKTVEYNNVALDSTLMPLVSDFLVASEELLNATKFLLEAYNPKGGAGKRATFSPKESILKMHSVYTQIVAMYPEAAKVDDNGPRLFSGQELSALFDLAEQKNPRMQLLKKPKDA